MNVVDQHEGHRERLRARFLSGQIPLTQIELLELVLSYAIPRKDLSPIAKLLLEKFGTIITVLDAPKDDLLLVEGVGESTVTFLKIIRTFVKTAEIDHLEIMKKQKEEKAASNQLQLFAADPNSAKKSLSDDDQQPKQKSMRVFANDEIQNALEILPKASNFNDLDAFKQYLTTNLPYNSEATRERRSNIILERFFPTGTIDNSMTYFASHCTTPQDLKALVFYHTLKAEPIATKVAEELIWPALPIGRVDREQVREFTLRYLPDLSDSSQKNMLRSIFYTYQLCSVGLVVKDNLRFNLRPGTFESFLYILTCEYPKPGIYTFESLF